MNGWLAIPSSSSAETMVHQGWDSLTIDLQHGMVDYQAMGPMLQAISTTNTVLVVRVPWLEQGMLIKTLDAGAYGVIAPWSTPANTPKNWSPTPTAHGVVAGIHNGTPEGALERLAKGFQFVTVSSDARLTAAGAQPAGKRRGCNRQTRRPAPGRYPDPHDHRATNRAGSGGTGGA